MRNKKEIYSSYQYRQANERFSRAKKRKKRFGKFFKFLFVFVLVVGLVFGLNRHKDDLAARRPDDINLMGSGENESIDVDSIPLPKLKENPELAENPGESKFEFKENEIDEENEAMMKDSRLVKRAFNEDDLINNLRVFAEKNPNANLIIERKEDLPVNLFRLAGNNYRSVDFVAKYIDPTIIDDYEYPRYGYSSKVPLYIQWDDEWGHQNYGQGVLGYTGCAPTSVAMVISALKNDPSIKPNKLAKISDKKGFSSEVGTSWDFYPYIADTYGLRMVQANPSYDTIKKNLENGNLIVVSVGQGDFTFESHVMAIVGLDKDGKLLIHDPNNVENSQKSWDYESVGVQMRAMWIFSNGGAIE